MGNKKENKTYECLLCNKFFSINGLKSHTWLCHTELGKIHRDLLLKTNKNKIIWNKGKTKETDGRVRKGGESLSNKIKSGEITPYWLNRKHTELTKKKISEKLSLHNKGGRCKWFDFTKKNGTIIALQGTWEVRFARILEIIDPDWIKPEKFTNKHSFKWVDAKQKIHTYTPDFYSPKINEYYEIKGFWWGNDKIKIKRVKKQNPSIIINIIEKKELESFEKKYHLTLDYKLIKHKSNKNYYIRTKNRCQCGNEKTKMAKLCSKCQSINSRKIKNRPSIQTLLYDIKNTNYTKTGKKYGVSPTTIKRWIGIK